MVVKLVSDDFKPTVNEMDARIFYEITGERLPGFGDKLHDEDSSGSESESVSDGDPPNSPTRVVPAFSGSLENSDEDTSNDDSQEDV